MTREEMQKKWTGWAFKVRKVGILAAYWIEAHDNPNTRDPRILGGTESSIEEAFDDLDRWMTKHIKRPKSREAAEGAKKDL